MSRYSLIILTVSSCIALLILLGLGTWQLQRLHQKNDLIVRVNERAARPEMISWADVVSGAGSEIDYRSVALSGSLSNKTAKLGYTSRNGEGGHQHIAALSGPDGHVLLVDLGWGVPDAAFAPVTQDLRIVGTIRDLSSHKPGWFSPEADLSKGLFFSPQPAALLAYLGHESGLPLMLRATETIPGVATMPNEVVIDYPNNHLSYALTWYGIALGLIGVYFAFVRHSFKSLRAGNEE